MARNAGALVIGYRREDDRRFVAVRARRARRGWITTPSGLAVRSEGTVNVTSSELDCTLVGGRCISCGADVYVNRLGASAIVEKDADVACMQCEDRYASDMTRSL